MKKILIALLLAALAGGAFYFWQQKNAQSPAGRYKTEAAGHADIRQVVAANGTLNPVTLVNVGTQVSGTVKKLHVDFNAKVTANQVLAELDDALFTAAAAQSAASIASAQATLELARANEARIRTLFKDEFVSSQELDQAVQALKAAQAALALAKAQNARDRANLGYSIIRSPVSGVVIDRQVDVGQTVAASFQTPVLFKIAQDLAHMQIDTTFAEADIGQIRVGQAVRFTVDAFPERNFRGEVRQIRLNPTNTQNVVTYNVVVGVDNPELLLLPGMTAYVSITVAERKNVLSVPNAALRFRPSAPEAGSRERPGAGPGARPAPGGERKKAPGGSSKLFVLAGDAVREVSVGTGITDNRLTEITTGELSPDERVIVGENLPESAGGQNGGFRMRMF